MIPVYEAGEADGLLYLIMRFVDGTDLRALIDSEGTLEPGRAAAIVPQVAAALGAAHRRELIHRDVKPANVLIAGHGDDRARLPHRLRDRPRGAGHGRTDKDRHGGGHARLHRP